MRAVAFLLALSASISWGFGALLLKRSSESFSATTVLLFQYALGALLVGLWLVGRLEVGNAVAAIGTHWRALFPIALFQILGYVCFVAAVLLAKESLPTATLVALASISPVLVAILSSPLLDESLGWHHALGVALIVIGIVVAQVF